MRLYTVEAGELTVGITFTWKNLGFAKVPIVKLGEERELILSPPYPLATTVNFGHIFKAGGKIQQLYMVDLRSDIGFNEIIVLAKNSKIYSFSAVISYGELACISLVSLGENFIIEGQKYLYNGASIVKLI